MKYETKYKILKFVKWVIRYPEFDHAPYMIKHEAKMEVIRSQITMPIREEVMMSKEQVAYTLGGMLMNELEKGEFVKYEKTEVPPLYDIPMVQIEGTLRVIKP